MTHWVKKLGIASAFALALGFSLPGEASATPSFCRSGAGHPVHGRAWCIDKGFGLGRSYARHNDYWRYPRTRYRYDNDHRGYWRPSWSYTPSYDWRYGNRARVYTGSGRWGSGDNYGHSHADHHRGHRHDRDCRH